MLKHRLFEQMPVGSPIGYRGSALLLQPFEPSAARHQAIHTW
jgi:hypothetical protein